jgi:cyclopropane-fatty-acyl-phospholipid synthase
VSSTGVRPVDRLLGRIVAGPASAAGASLRLWNGEPLAPLDDTAGERPAVTIHSRRRLLATLLDPARSFADGYVDGSVTIDGDLLAVLEAADRRAAPDGRLSRGLRARLPHWLRVPSAWRAIGPAAARVNARHHYDLGNDFFASWLDPTMTYTCAYFADPGATLEQAQRAKMELVCRKLALRDGERVVEAGCGWGSLALYMAERHGARVRAFNVSPVQIAYARSEARRRGLEHRVEFIEDDYRSISGAYDAFVSIGMLETVGRRHYRELGGVIARTIGRSGRGMLHSIGRHEPYPTDRWIARHIFPGSYYPSLREMLAVFEPNGLAVVDVENLRQHYAHTLEHWLAGFEAHATEIEAAYSDRFVRMWRLYLAAALAAFRTAWLELYQVVFTPAHAARTLVPTLRAIDPWTRSALAC